jgi:threonyl-tRNA synthetase
LYRRANWCKEAADFIALTLQVYKDFGFDEVALKLSTRPAKRVGSDELWDSAEAAMAKALNDAGLDWELQAGEGAFYGPKIEFSLKDCLGRVWQCGTLQLDFNLPTRLDASFVAEDNSRRPPVMLHRAILGSFERFIGVLIEHYAGLLPPWLAPVQAVVMNITDHQAEASQKFVNQLKAQGFRVLSDLRNEKIGFKIRERTLERIPYLLVVGDREVEQNTVSVRTRDGKDLGSMSLPEFADKLRADIALRGRVSLEK